MTRNVRQSGFTAPRAILVAFLLAIHVFPSIAGCRGISSLTAEQEFAGRFEMYEDSARMKREIMRHIRPGMSVNAVSRLMTDNGFKCRRMDTEGEAPHLYCDLQRCKHFGVDERWQVGVHFNPQGTDVRVCYGLIGL